MNFTLFLAQAAEAAAAPAAQGGAAPAPVGGGMSMLVPMILIFALFYFMMIRPQQRKEKERLKMIREIRSGTRVILSSGIIGTIVECKDSTFLIETAGTRMEVLRNAVQQALAEGEKIAEPPTK
ncbi:MAG: preprotein translocase subunit YajC [Kiritimatiellae bacterium]|nr:preprotein translocase subunit YajC [Kiritimatiellia bacterium]